MKRTYVLILLFALFALFPQLKAQETRTINIKAEKNVNGQVTVIDTTITTTEEVDMQALLRELGLEAEASGTKVKVMKLHKDHQHGETEAASENGLHEEEREVMVNVTVDEDGQEHISIKVNGEEVDPEEFEGDLIIRHLDQEGGENSWTDEEGNTLHFKSGKVIFLSDEQLSEEERAKKIEELKENGHNVFIMEAGTEGVQLEGQQGEQHLNVEVTVEGDENGQEVQIVEIEVHCIIEELKQEDQEALRKAGIPLGNSLQLSGLSFYPNPSDGRFSLDFESPETGDLQIRILDAQGKQVYQEVLPGFSGAYHKQIDISTRPSGLYFLSLSQNGKVASKRIVME